MVVGNYPNLAVKLIISKSTCEVTPRPLHRKE
jgi:hypothetical protein